MFLEDLEISFGNRVPTIFLSCMFSWSEGRDSGFLHGILGLIARSVVEFP